ncbi:MAG TPA: hypothetical protein DCE41_24520 [Cytophagales bacterium]|nr:hypothetical protein [Cytophagales bacterium]HAA21457.1 hypothetical protein [Cytophagales bacterium]HAP65234.1 hypothetical protein [Cytophagales bacterium]
MAITDITGKYSLNTNQNLGYMELTQEGTRIFGKMYWYTNRKDEDYYREDTFEGTITQSKKAKSVELTFSRKINPQDFKGWMSQDYKLISGFFDNGLRYAWVATKLP